MGKRHTKNSYWLVSVSHVVLHLIWIRSKLGKVKYFCHISVEEELYINIDNGNLEGYRHFKGQQYTSK